MENSSHLMSPHPHLIQLVGTTSSLADLAIGITPYQRLEVGSMHHGFYLPYPLGALEEEFGMATVLADIDIESIGGPHETQLAVYRKLFPVQFLIAALGALLWYNLCL